MTRAYLFLARAFRHARAFSQALDVRGLVIRYLFGGRMRSFPKMPVHAQNSMHHSRVQDRMRSYVSTRHVRKQQEVQAHCDEQREIEIVQTHLGLLALLHAMQEI